MSAAHASLRFLLLGTTGQRRAPGLDGASSFPLIHYAIRYKVQQQIGLTNPQLIQYKYPSVYGH